MPSRVQPSPARSTRGGSRRSAVDENDEWDRASLMSNSPFKVPHSRTGRKGASTNSFMTGTSVQVAAAFHAAQGATHLPSPPPSTRAPTSGRSAGIAPRGASTAATSGQPHRALSPAESIASSARALSPVRFFLRPSEDELSMSGEYSSFASMGAGHGRGSDSSYNYSREEEFMRAATPGGGRASTIKRSVGGGGMMSGPRLSDPSKRKKKGDDDMPYRPGVDDEIVDGGESDDEGGEGVVRSGALSGRAGTRGKRAERGEGYLGNGLGLQPRRSKSRKSGEMETDEGVGESEEDISGQAGGRSYSHSPFVHGQVATPASLLQSLSPRISQPPISRRRQPTALRTVITNVLHGIALALRFVVDLVYGLLSKAVLTPLRLIFGSTRAATRHFKKHWWQYVCGILALSLALRLVERPWRRGAYTPLDNLPENTQELLERLAHIERTLSSISKTSQALEDSGGEIRRVTDGMGERVGKVEGAVRAGKESLDGWRAESGTAQSQLQEHYDQLKSEVDRLLTRISAEEQGLSTAQAKLSRVDTLSSDVKKLQERMGKVESDVKSALDDGRLSAALERILPHNIPIRFNAHREVVIDPMFWNELRKTMMGRDEAEKVVLRAIEGKVATRHDGRMSYDEKQLDAWGDKFAAKLRSKDAGQTQIDKAWFIEVLNNNLDELRGTIDDIRKKAAGTSIKSAKGDDLTGALQSLIDAALLRYSKDTLARPDYALFSAGGRVVPSITSDTLVLSTPGAFGRMVLGRKPVEGLSPAHALMPDLTVGKCWPFTGGEGQLGVMLSRRVVVGDLTVEHAAKEVAVDIKSAPRRVEVWGLVEGEENQDKARAYLERNPQSDASMPPSSNYLLLSSFEYDPSLPNHIQTVPVSSDLKDLQIDMGVVVFKVLENWGGEFTCLYRVRVHGEVPSETVQAEYH